MAQWHSTYSKQKLNGTAAQYSKQKLDTGTSVHMQYKTNTLREKKKMGVIERQDFTYNQTIDYLMSPARNSQLMRAYTHVVVQLNGTVAQCGREGLYSQGGKSLASPPNRMHYIIWQSN